MTGLGISPSLTVGELNSWGGSCTPAPLLHRACRAGPYGSKGNARPKHFGATYSPLTTNNSRFQILILRPSSARMSFLTPCLSAWDLILSSIEGGRSGR